MQERVGGKRSGDEVGVKRKRKGDSASDGGWNWNCSEKTNSMRMLMERSRISCAQELVLMEHFMNCPRANFDLITEAKEAVKPSTLRRNVSPRNVSPHGSKNKSRHPRRSGSRSDSRLGRRK